MAGNLFDVFVVGATDPTPAGEARLAAALSAKHGLPVATVARAIATKNLRAGQGLEQAQAQTLVRQLQGMGAVTVIRPVAGAAKSASKSATASPAPAPAVATPSARQTMAPLSDQWAAFGPPPATHSPSTMSPPPGGAAAGLGAVPPLSDPSAMRPDPAGRANPFGMQPPSGAHADPFAPGPNTGSRPDPFAPPPMATVTPQIRQPTPSPRSAPAPADDFAPPVAAAGPKLELARGGLAQSLDEKSGLIRMTGARVLRDTGGGAASGVAMDEDPRNLELVRCAQHGLYYDKSKASGCRKCLSAARELAQGLENRSVPTRVGDFRSSPAKRAFAGLGLALLLGLLPAAYLAFGPGASRVRQLRVEQEVLSRQPGTEQMLRRFDELEELVSQARDSSLRNTAVVWAAVSAAAMFGWYRIT